MLGKITPEISGGWRRGRLGAAGMALILAACGGHKPAAAPSVFDQPIKPHAAAEAPGTLKPSSFDAQVLVNCDSNPKDAAEDTIGGERPVGSTVVIGEGDVSNDTLPDKKGAFLVLRKIGAQAYKLTGRDANGQSATLNAQGTNQIIGTSDQVLIIIDLNEDGSVRVETECLSTDPASGAPTTVTG